MSSLKVSKKEAKAIEKALAYWSAEQIISPEVSQTLSRSYQISPFDWMRLARYSFWLAIASLLISISAALADEWLIELLQSVFAAPDSIKCIFLAALAGGFYFLGMRRKATSPTHIFSNEAILFLGVAATAGAIAYLGKILDTGTGHFSLLLLFASIVYGLLGIWFPSKLVWIFSLLSLGSWFGAETGYASGWGAYYLGMNYPLRFVLFGLVLLGVSSFVFSRLPVSEELLRPTRIMGLLYLFIALWIMSIFGNYGDSESWFRAKQIELFHWSLLFATAAIASIYHGLKYDDGMTRGFGITFLFINLYTRFFEYFWDDTHKALFFAILGLSFWYLGSKAEKIWRLESLQHSIKSNVSKNEIHENQ